MAIPPGTRLGIYEVTAQIGAGGMGEVYRATDRHLKRAVAIKVLPDAMACDADRLARFQREAEVLAALNHPNIGAIYGFEKTPNFTALVMELVEGEDLSQRIARGAIPIDEALPIVKQIADALEAAHEQGIIHRDLKPANIKVRADGTVKVLDFGLAKAMEPTAGSSSNLSMSPTITTPAMTAAGIFLGTAAYMSPEQARGKTVDKRSDIWAFGAVLYEMLTGVRPFDGEDTTEMIAAVVKTTPDWSVLPTDVPGPIVTLIQRCLAKDRKVRVGDIAAAQFLLENYATLATSSVAVSSGPAPRSTWSRALPWTVAGGLGVVLLASLLWARWRPARVPEPRKLLASIGADASLPNSALGASVSVSPDGTALVFAAQQAGGTRLFIRKLDQLQATALASTEGAAGPFFSPDGRWIAFFAGGKLKKVSVAGGAAVTLCDAPFPRGGSWGDDDTILFMPTNGNGTLMRIPAAGGSATPFGALLSGALMQRWPQVLPGGKAVLYSESAQANWDTANLVVAPLHGGTPQIVVRSGYHGRYVSSGRGGPNRAADDSGHLIYIQQGTLFAVRFDLDRLETVGQAVPALEGIAADRATGSAQLAVSADGTLVYVPGTDATTLPIDWMARDGTTSVLRAAKANWSYPRFSPDGRKLALQIHDGKQSDIWVYEWASDTLRQLTFDPGNDRIPVWTPDSRRIVFQSDRGKHGDENLYWANADGTGEVTRLTDGDHGQWAQSWHPSGKFLAFTTNFADRSDLMILPMEGDAARGWTPGAPTVFLTTPGIFNAYPRFSPDGRWLAYVSSEGGRDEVYVRPFPGPGGKWRVSNEGGTLPVWSATTHELLFVDSARNKIMEAPYSVAADSFRADKPELWSPASVTLRGLDYTYDLHPDGKRLALPPPPDSSAQDKVVFFLNFADYLRKAAPGTK